MEKSKFLFDSVFDEDFSFKSVQSTKYEFISHEDCEIFSNLKVQNKSLPQNNFFNLGLLEGVLIIFKYNHGEPVKYLKKEQIGLGGNSQVYLVQKAAKIAQESKLIDKYALKVIRKTSIHDPLREIAQLKEEIMIQRRLVLCETALQILKVYECKSKLYLLLEYQEGGSLLDLAKENVSITERDIQTIMAQVLLGLDFIHKENIVHRDIKLENILLRTKEEGVYEIRIADFGLAKAIKPNENIFHRCGTPSYIAPEILRDQGYGTKADIFSVGSLMYNLVSGRYLFSQSSKQNILLANKLCDITHVPNAIRKLSKQGQDLLMKLLESNPAVRLNAQQALNHPWFSLDKEALLEGLRINCELHNIVLEKKSFIDSSYFKGHVQEKTFQNPFQEPQIQLQTNQIIEKLNVRDRGRNNGGYLRATTVQISYSQSQKYRSQSKQGSRTDGHRKRTGSFRPNTNPNQDSQKSMNHCQSLTINRYKNQSSAYNCQFNIQEEESKNSNNLKQISKNGLKQSQNIEISHEDSQRKQPQQRPQLKLLGVDNQMIELCVSNASKSHKSSFSRMSRQSNVSDPSNISDYEGDEKINEERNKSTKKYFCQVQNSKFMGNKSQPKQRRILFDIESPHFI
ncbi:serine threonine protein kinase [Stylonychia lemnae]|uniref:Serine threonine protein kinase n=1 Tax=Stylonychia lemnae TaxID=5949 RepID=A0A078A5G3_STYLE|nr:serine threonine protein kinase [Stylonychia lemnae]|eukprot:CDW76825.1 serine threonine protein kinase [Stylonychia lemnae]